ncbi:hypothetical protein [Desulfoluna sp.]|uniref:flavodoxin family protein n=1 Tax=Desulfoluna sp. TaxID=2045199 RepID=UPI0026389D3C|nr:hypothetical protein [Desulfoluna sp.]
MKKTLLVYYSRTGTTEALAEGIQERLGCDMEVIIDQKNRDGFFGNLCGGLDALLERQTLIKPPTHDPAGYDRVIIGTPVWYGNLTPAVRTWLCRHTNEEPRFKTAFFCTFAGGGNERAAKKFMGLVKSKCGAVLSIQKGEDDETIKNKIGIFTDSLAAATKD